MEGLVLRLAADADRPAIVEMAREVVAAGEMFAYDTVEGVLGYWFDRRGRLFVAELDGDVVGTYVVKPNQPGRGAHVANAGYITAERARGRGVGRAMGAHSLEVARDMGFAAMQFNFVVETNAGAVELWRDLGFRVVGTQPKSFRRPSGELVDVLVMYREL